MVSRCSPMMSSTTKCVTMIAAGSSATIRVTTSTQLGAPTGTRISSASSHPDCVALSRKLSLVVCVLSASASIDTMRRLCGDQHELALQVVEQPHELDRSTSWTDRSGRCCRSGSGRRGPGRPAPGRSRCAGTAFRCRLPARARMGSASRLVVIASTSWSKRPARPSRTASGSSRSISTTTCSIGRPSTPPRELISSTARVEPRVISSPSAEHVPQVTATVPI